MRIPQVYLDYLQKRWKKNRKEEEQEVSSSVDGQTIRDEEGPLATRVLNFIAQRE
jgi:hypothetical protein